MGIRIASSSDLNWLQDSPTAKAAQRLQRLSVNGESVVDFTQGRPEPPDFPLPNGFSSGIAEAVRPRNLRKQRNVYTSLSGLLELRELIAKDFSEETGIVYNSSEVVISAGGRTLLYLALRVLVDKNDAQDEVLYATPAWPTYPQLIRLVGGRPVEVKLKPPYKLKCEDIRRRLLDANLGAVLLNSPNNPTGAIIDPEELEKIARVITEERDKLYSRRPVGLILDWLYKDLVFNRNAHSIVSVNQEFKSRTIIIDGASKTYNATGQRLAYAAGPENLIRAMVRVQSCVPGPAPSAEQYGLLSALTKYRRETERELEVFWRRHRRNRNYALNELSVADLEPLRPEGTFYLWLKVPVGAGCRYKDSREWSEALLEQQRVGVVSGEEFGAAGYVRLSLAVSWKNLKEGIRRIQKFVELVQENQNPA